MGSFIVTFMIYCILERVWRARGACHTALLYTVKEHEAPLFWYRRQRRRPSRRCVLTSSRYGYSKVCLAGCKQCTVERIHQPLQSVAFAANKSRSHWGNPCTRTLGLHTGAHERFLCCYFGFLSTRAVSGAHLLPLVDGSRRQHWRISLSDRVIICSQSATVPNIQKHVDNFFLLYN